MCDVRGAAAEKWGAAGALLVRTYFILKILMFFFLLLVTRQVSHSSGPASCVTVETAVVLYITLTGMWNENINK